MGAQSSSSEDEARHTVSFLDKDLFPCRNPPQPRDILKRGKQGTTRGGLSREKGAQRTQEDLVDRQNDHQKPETPPLTETCLPNLVEDLKVINVSDFKLEKLHIDLLSRGLSFSPTSTMDHFEVYKDLCLFLRRVYYKVIHSARTPNGD